MRNLCLLGLAISLASPSVWAQTPTTPLPPKDVFVSDLMKQMTEAEKIGQLRLISIATDMPRELIRKEIAAGHIGGKYQGAETAQAKYAEKSFRQAHRMGMAKGVEGTAV